MQDFRYCLWTSILDCFGQLVSPPWILVIVHSWCNFTGVFSSKSWTSFTVAFFWPSWMLDLNCLFIMTTPQYMQAWYCTFSGMFSTKQTSENFNIDLCLTFLNIGTRSRLSCLVIAVTNQELHSLCFIFTGLFFSKSQTSSTLTFGKMLQDELACMDCMHDVVTLRGGSRHLNLCWAKGFRHQRCLFLILARILSMTSCQRVVLILDYHSHENEWFTK